MQTGRERRSSGTGGWSVARLQRIGNWDRADEALGRHWEEVGLEALANMLARPRPMPGGAYVPRSVLALADDEGLRREVHASGLPNPDACLIGATPAGSGVLQSVDFKWSLERAQRPQVEDRAQVNEERIRPLSREHHLTCLESGNRGI